MIRPLVPLLLALGASSCVLNSGSPGVMLATSPPGARVLLDGADSGFATPCWIDVDEDASVRFELEGYRAAERELVFDTRVWLVPWWDGDIGARTWRFPTFLTFFGLLLPVRYERNVFPKRVYVPLEVATEG